MIEHDVLIRWRKNGGTSIIIHTCLFVAAYGFGIQYQNSGDTLLLIVCFGFIIIFILSLVISFFTWNGFIYLNEERFWIRKKTKIIEWRIDNIRSCRIMRKPFWTTRFVFEIISSDNPKPLISETYTKVERILMQITKNKPNRDIFEKAFK